MMRVRVSFAIVALFIDIGINNIAEPVQGQLTEIFLISCLQIAAPLIFAVVLYINFMSTKYMQLGLFGRVLKEFKFPLLALLLHFCLVLAVRVFRIVSYSNKLPQIFLWSIPGYYPIYIIQRVSDVLFYALALQAVYKLCDPSLYE
eukprot:CAMPEP_0113916864 /NCGR_PEP_ID=MMETSP0780_2-20120614/32334_1 /TAXON_ID=652834 /ORGANISM="Palpitomonas bilix" /LENGTH=145 /DNA_ID=CAMNT_0000916211 /DNA_START=185 /DNA_END=622 /DNA_ORIENTATION=+ /assembly_acc=CAM_ASM_000599